MRLVYFALMFTLLMAPLPAQADMVLDWNEYALETIRLTASNPPYGSRALAITQAAVFDSVNSIYPQYTPYKFQVTVNTPTSAKAAVAAASYTSLAALFPSQSGNLHAKYTASLAAIPDSQAKTDGINLGIQVANAMVTLRSTDGWNAPSSYTPTPGVGHWQPTPPGFAPPLLPQWGNVTPFTMTSNIQFLQPAPPAINSAEYAAAFNEVKELGSLTSATRTADQTNSALFWSDGGGTETPPGHWNSIAQTVATSQNNTLAVNARLFALLNLAEADAAIAAWYMKYEYDLWRPITGIQAADDGNPLTDADPSWTPLLGTPPFPSYVSGHSTFSGAAAAVLAELFGDATAFSSTADNGLTRNFSSFSQAAAEAGMSRIYGGIHWQFDNIYGLQAGDELGQYVYANFLVPTPLPGTLTMTLTGLGAMLLAAWRRR